MEVVAHRMNGWHTSHGADGTPHMEALEFSPAMEREAHKWEEHCLEAEKLEAEKLEAHKREAHSREAHKREAHAREEHKREAHKREAHAREEHKREAHKREAHTREEHCREAHIREAHKREAHTREEHCREAHKREAHKMEEDTRNGDKKSTSVTVNGVAGAGPKWAQRTVTLPPYKRGCHHVTPTILKDIEADLAPFTCGLAHFFLQHTSASLTINENYDSDVLDDIESWLSGTIPEGKEAPWRHKIEGPDDMPAHIKSSVFGCQFSIPITNGRLNFGTWQGILLCEHRNQASARKVVITMTGV